MILNPQQPTPGKTNFIHKKTKNKYFLKNGKIFGSEVQVKFLNFFILFFRGGRGRPGGLIRGQGLNKFNGSIYLSPILKITQKFQKKNNDVKFNFPE